MIGESVFELALLHYAAFLHCADDALVELLNKKVELMQEVSLDGVVGPAGPNG